MAGASHQIRLHPPLKSNVCGQRSDAHSTARFYLYAQISEWQRIRVCLNARKDEESARHYNATKEVTLTGHVADGVQPFDAVHRVGPASSFSSELQEHVWTRRVVHMPLMVAMLDAVNTR